MIIVSTKVGNTYIPDGSRESVAELVDAIENNPNCEFREAGSDNWTPVLGALSDIESLLIDSDDDGFFEVVENWLHCHVFPELA
jgi:hypothetical protein